MQAMALQSLLQTARATAAALLRIPCSAQAAAAMTRAQQWQQRSVLHACWLGGSQKRSRRRWRLQRRLLSVQWTQPSWTGMFEPICVFGAVIIVDLQRGLQRMRPVMTACCHADPFLRQAVLALWTSHMFSSSSARHPVAGWGRACCMAYFSSLATCAADCGSRWRRRPRTLHARRCMRTRWRRRRSAPSRRQLRSSCRLARRWTG